MNLQKILHIGSLYYQMNEKNPREELKWKRKQAVRKEVEGSGRNTEMIEIEESATR